MSQQEPIFIAFMEGVCKKFNCAEAAAPLSDGFKAFCESAEMAAKPKNQVEAASYDLSWSSDGEEKPLGKNFSRIDVANTLRNFRDWKTSDQIRNSKPINYKVPTDSHNGPSFHITPTVKLDDTIPVVNTGYHQVDGLAESTKRYVQQLALDKFGIKLEYEDTIGLANRHGDDSGYCGQGFSGIAIDASYESGPVHPSEEFDELAKILKPMGFRHVTSPSESDGFSSSTYHEFVFEPSIHKCDVEN